MPRFCLTKSSKILAAFALVLLLEPAAFSSNNRHATVRVTTGSVQINNWQQNLVKNNPNLGRWHWNPIYANLQGVKNVRESEGNSTGKQKHGTSGGPNQNVIYKPIAQSQPHSHYIKPNHIPFNTTPRTDVSANLRSTDLNGTLRQNNVNGVLRNNSVAGTLMSRETNARLADKDTGNGRDASDSGQKEAAPPAPPHVATYGPPAARDDFSGVAVNGPTMNERTNVSATIASGKKNRAGTKSAGGHKAPLPKLNY